jgi:hypothetical protein
MTDFFFFMELFVDICYSETFHSDLHNDILPVAQSFRRYLMQESKKVVNTGPRFDTRTMHFWETY